MPSDVRDELYVRPGRGSLLVGLTSSPSQQIMALVGGDEEAMPLFSNQIKISIMSNANLNRNIVNLPMHSAVLITSPLHRRTKRSSQKTGGMAAVAINTHTNSTNFDGGILIFTTGTYGCLKILNVATLYLPGGSGSATVDSKI